MHIERIQAGCLQRDSPDDSLDDSLDDSPGVAKPMASDRVIMRHALAGAALLCLAMTLGACSGSGSGSASGSGSGSGSGSASAEVPSLPPDSTGAQGEIPDSLLQLEDDPGFLSSIPNVVSSEIRADTGLQVAYTREGQDTAVPGALVEEQWVYMQTCVGQQSTPPLVVVREGAVVPFTQTDDVIFNIEGIAVASASLRVVSVIQIQEADFDGSLGSLGFNLRSIMGRLLWLSADLPERDYPFNCARQQPE